METGILTIPSGDLPADGSKVAITAQDYTAFGAIGNVYLSGESILLSTPITGTLAETNGLFSQSAIILPGTMQGCGAAGPARSWLGHLLDLIYLHARWWFFRGVHLFQQ